MTFAKLKSSSPTEVPDDLIYILKICGWREKDQKSLSACMKKFQKHLSLIEEAVVKLKAATMEGVTSTDVTPYIIDAKTQFEPSYMINAYSTGSRTDSKGNTVLCTTDIGLQSVVMKRSRNGGKARPREEVWLKAKVALFSAFN